MPPRPEPCSSSSSSLGNDSDEGGAPAGKEDADGEVQSAYSGAGHDGLAALEESLPIRRGISKFYNGKSRSFTFLKEAIGPSGSAKVIAKADNAYSRKRKNLLAYSIMYDRSQITVPETCDYGISKRLAGLSRLRPLDGMSSNSSSSSSSSLSSDENEPPQHFIFIPSPDNPAITAPQLGSCAPKILPVPTRSFSMVNLHRLHRHCSSVCLKEEQGAD